MPLYSLLKYSRNHRKATAILWNYYRDEPNNPPADNYNADPITNSASFKYKNSITGKIPNNNNNDNVIKGVETIVALKHFGSS